MFNKVFSSRNKFVYILFWGLCFLLVSCSKALDTKPKNQILADAQFSTDKKANDAVVGIYSTFYENNSLSGTYSSDFPLFTGLSSDELLYIGDPQSGSYPLFNRNVLNSRDPGVSGLWAGTYNIIYQANSVIEKVAASGGISAAGKEQFTGEAKFIRSLCYFYLVNMFGPVPLVTTTDYHISSTIGRTPVETVYQQMVDDLTAAAALLKEDYITDGRVRANKFAALALLARVYLYMGDTKNAEANATQVINSGNYTLENSYDEVFLSTSNEAILQFYTTGYTVYGSAVQSSSNRSFRVNLDLVNSFESGDLRKNAFVLPSVSTPGTYLPSKYKNINDMASVIEYYMVLRLAEQYLIRAEALAKQENIAAALADVNLLRNRAGLSPLSNTISKNNLLLAIAKERRVELCFEWGDRWFNLKRTGEASNVLSKLKPGWVSTSELYPIPLQEIQKNPSQLSQNQGY